MRFWTAFGLCGLFFLVIGCSESAPVIEKVEWRVIYRDQGFRREELLLFVRVSDSDDDEDPNEITVIAEETGYQWHFTRSEWIPVNSDGEKFWGMPGMIPYNGNSLPNALYTVRLTDLAGQTDETTFRLKSGRPSILGFKWPAARVVNGRLEYSGEDKNPVLILRGSNLAVIQKTPAFNGYRIPQIEAAWWEIWVGLGDKSGGIRIGPHPLPRQ